MADSSLQIGPYEVAAKLDDKRLEGIITMRATILLLAIAIATLIEEKALRRSHGSSLSSRF